MRFIVGMGRARAEVEEKADTKDKDGVPLMNITSSAATATTNGRDDAKKQLLRKFILALDMVEVVRRPGERLYHSHNIIVLCGKNGGKPAEAKDIEDMAGRVAKIQRYGGKKSSAAKMAGRNATP